MPITIDIKKDYLYNLGLEEGLEKGLEKGNLKIEENRKNTIVKMYQGGLQVDRIGDFLEVPEEFVLVVLRQAGLLDA